MQSCMQHVLQDTHQAVFATLDREGGADALTQAAVPFEHVSNGRHESQVGSLGCAGRHLICQEQGDLHDYQFAVQS